MKLGVFDPIYGHLDLEPMLDRIVEVGLEAVELGCGSSPNVARRHPRRARERSVVSIPHRPPEDP